MEKKNNNILSFFMMLCILSIIFITIICLVLLPEITKEHNTKPYESVNIYDVNDCEFITEQQEYWCISNDNIGLVSRVEG